MQARSAQPAYLVDELAPQVNATLQVVRPREQRIDKRHARRLQHKREM